MWSSISAQTRPREPGLTGAMAQEANGLEWTGRAPSACPLSVPDVTPYATEAASKGAQCVIALDVIPAQSLSLLKAMVPSGPGRQIRQGRYLHLSGHAERGRVGGSVDHGPRARTRYWYWPSTAPRDTSNPAVKQWVSDLTTYGPKPPYLEYEGGTVWAELQLAIKAADAPLPQ